MIFGKIEYLNLLPFHIFMKRFTKSSQQSISMHYYRGVPAKVNKKFLSRRVDAAFISSVTAKNHRHVDLGIIAKKEVLSVLVIPHAKDLKDTESATSNVLAQVLGIGGEVLIGDKALRYYLEKKPHVDLAKMWNEKYNLPFVFALLCYHKEKKIYKKIQKEFLKRKVKIPQYILKEASLRTKIDTKDILNYLEYISYNLDAKAKKGLKLFNSLS
ncbi:MAG: MqnA/MqnD/SBP family protein [Campylobacterota bacterium]|nr:MqnA/MqnD/SBP family protein [Campylobacterota bacterium]